MTDWAPTEVPLAGPLGRHEVVRIARGAAPMLLPEARARLDRGRRLLEAVADGDAPAYGINTGVGALCDTIVPPDRRAELSRNIVMSHAAGIGTPLGRVETRAIMAAQISNFLHGASGVRPEIVEALCALLAADCVPIVPARGSVGYLTHAAAIALVPIGAGEAMLAGARLSGADAMARIGRAPILLQAKEGLSLVNGTPCASGLAALALDRLGRLLDWADATAAMSYELLGGQVDAFAAETLALRTSPGVAQTGEVLRAYLAGSALLAARAGARTQDPLSLRAIPQLHGSVRDAVAAAALVVDRELASVTDNPALAGTSEAPRVHMGAQAVGFALAHALDGLGVAAAQLAMMAERRIDRLLNPLVSGLPAFLAAEGGACSGLMIAQYTAAALVAENRRLAAPASLDGGITSALQEDVLPHATPAAIKLLAILDNLGDVLAIEALCAAQGYDLAAIPPAPLTGMMRDRVRAAVQFYSDDRPLGADIAAVRAVIRTPPADGAP